jgi:hypothetical protein
MKSCIQFEKELGPLSPEETTVSRKFVKFIMDFAIKGFMDNMMPHHQLFM